jgi:ribosome-associated protein
MQQLIYGALEDAKGKDIVVLDVRKVCDFTDNMVIVTGSSNRHVTTVADKVLDRLRAHGVRPVGVEGLKTGDWALIDFGDVVVHVMRAPIRDFYNLEKLWGDAKHIEMKDSSTPRRKVTKKKKKKSGLT